MCVKKVLKIATVTVIAITILILHLPFILGGVFEGLAFYKFVIQDLSTPNPPKPNITYGEFPFSLVYELNGEEKVVEDTLIGEYDGITRIGGPTNKSRSWIHSFMSGDKLITLLRIDETDVIHYPFLTNTVGYYMGDNKYGPQGFSSCAYRHNSEEDPNYNRDGYYISPDELLNKYGIKIISWEIAPPIENTFK